MTVRLSIGSGDAGLLRHEVFFPRPSRKGNRSGSKRDPPMAGMRSDSCSMPSYTARNNESSRDQASYLRSRTSTPYWSASACSLARSVETA